MSARYDRVEYYPPIPVLRVKFGKPGHLPWDGPYDAIVDTGADGTILPKEIAIRVGAVPMKPVRLESHWGDEHYATEYVVELEIEEFRLSGIMVAGDPHSTEIILGRNVLNKLPLFLDGPQLQTHLLSEATTNRLRARLK